MMITLLPSFDLIHLIVVIIWLVYYSLRLLQHSHNPVFLKMPWLILWIIGYVFGWCYILNNYSAQVYLQYSLLPLTDFPMTIIAKLAVFSLVDYMFFYTMRFYSPYNKAWYREAILITSLSTSCIIISFLWTQSQPFHILFWIGDILLFMNGMLALFMLLQVSQRFKNQIIPTIEYIHFIWFAGCVIFASIGLVCSTISAIDGLMTQRLSVRDNWLELGYIAYIFALICMAGLTSPDEFLYWTGYPLRLLRIRKLNKLYFYILSSVPISERYPISAYRIGQHTEYAMYERVISIFDIYPFLDSSDDLFQQLKRVENQYDSYLDCAEALMRLEIPEFKLY